MLKHQLENPYPEIPIELTKCALNERTGFEKDAIEQIAREYQNGDGFNLLLDTAIMRPEQDIRGHAIRGVAQIILESQEDVARGAVKLITRQASLAPKRIKNVVLLLNLEGGERALNSVAQVTEFIKIELLQALLASEEREGVLSSVSNEMMDQNEEISAELALDILGVLRDEDVLPKTALFAKQLLPVLLDRMKKKNVLSFLEGARMLRNSNEVPIFAAILLNQGYPYEAKTEAARLLGTSWNEKAFAELLKGIDDSNTVLRRNIYEYAKQATCGGDDEESAGVANMAENILLAGVTNRAENARLRIDLVRWFAENGGESALKTLEKIDILGEDWSKIEGMNSDKENKVKQLFVRGLDKAINVIQTRCAAKAKIKKGGFSPCFGGLTARADSGQPTANCAASAV